jgi:hypothetical protein
VLVLVSNCGEPLEVPLYTAVRLYEPTLRVGEQVAVFPLSATSSQITVGPSLKSTVPTLFGFPALAVTVAVKVKLSP